MLMSINYQRKDVKYLKDSYIFLTKIFFLLHTVCRKFSYGIRTYMTFVRDRTTTRVVFRRPRGDLLVFLFLSLRTTFD